MIQSRPGSLPERVSGELAKLANWSLRTWPNAQTHGRCLGLAFPPTPEMAHLLAFTYPQAFLDAFTRVSSEKDLLAFKFVCLSGAFVEKDQSRSLWFLDQERKVRVSHPSSEKSTKRCP
jgi:hypothetical protein